MNRKNEDVYIQNVNKVCAFLEKNYLNDIRFSDVIPLISIGECNFKKYFKKETGFSVMHYFKRYKIRKAAELIEDGSFTFTQISVFLGYDSVHCFSRQFKAVTGMSPTEYKTKVRYK